MKASSFNIVLNNFQKIIFIKNKLSYFHMQQEEKRLRLNCETNPDTDLLVIYIGDNPSNKSTCLCIECVPSGNIKHKDFLNSLK